MTRLTCLHTRMPAHTRTHIHREALGALADAIKRWTGGVVVISHHQEFIGAVCGEVRGERVWASCFWGGAWLIGHGELDCEHYRRCTAQLAKLCADGSTHPLARRPSASNVAQTTTCALPQHH